MRHVLNTFFLSTLALAVTSCGKKQDQQAGHGPIPYPVVEVPVKTVTGYQAFPANIEGKITNSVRAKISGYIQEMYVDEGQFVNEGQVLFKLETNTLTQTANAAKSSIVAAESNVNVAQVEVNKLIPLVDKNIVSSIQLETAKANLERAKSQLAAAKSDYQSVTANIDYSLIKSPISGIVGALPLKVGSLVGPSDPTPLTVVSDDSEMYVYFSMNEKEYFDFIQNTEGKTNKEKLANLPEVSLQLANGVLYEEKGKIEALTGQVDPATGTVRFRAIFKNPNRLLSNGNSGIILIPRIYTDVLVVPESATYEQQGIIYVYKVENDTAKSTVVQVIDRIDRMALISSGVEANTPIVASGLGTLRSGAAIAPQPVKFDSIINTIQPTFKTTF